MEESTISRGVMLLLLAYCCCCLVTADCVCGASPGLEEWLEPGSPPWSYLCQPSHMNPSQRIQESCQSGTKWLMETQVKVRRKRGAQKDRGSPPPSLSQKNTRLCRANRDARVGGHLRLSGQMGPHAHRRQRLRRESALRSPCSSTEPLCSPRQVVV